MVICERGCDRNEKGELTMQSGKSKPVSYVGLGILAILFVLLNMVSSNLFQGARVDLTENSLYTLSSGTVNIVKTIDEPITLHYFFSDQASENIPQLRTYANRVRELLQEYAQLSNGKITLNIIDPVPYSEEEDQAAEFALQGVPVGGAGNSIFDVSKCSAKIDDSRCSEHDKTKITDEPVFQEPDFCDAKG